MLLLLSIFIPLAIVLSVAFWSFLNGISPTPSTVRQTRLILKCIADLPKNKIYEIGSGAGTLAIAIARKFPDSEVTGIENSPFPYVVSRLLKSMLRVRNLQFRWREFGRVNLGDADVVVVYLHRAGMRKLKEQLHRQLRPGAYVVSNTFSFPEWKAEKEIATGDLYRSKIFLYRFYA